MTSEQRPSSSPLIIDPLQRNRLLQSAGSRSVRRFDRRTALGLGGAGLATLALGAAGRQVAAQATSTGTPITLAWNATAICTASAPVAQEEGIFADHGLNVEFVNFGGSTEQLLEAIATGKADAGVGMALRWLKPLEQGFDVNITAGIHGGCMRLLGSTEGGFTTLESLRGKKIAISDQAGPAKNFFSILFQKNGIDPFTEVEWLQYPADVLPLAIEKGETHALADGDPRTWIFLENSNGALTEIATNLSNEYARRTCCIVGIRGSLVRDEREVATALTKALLEAGEIVVTKPEIAARAFAKYGGQGTEAQLIEILSSQTHGHQPVGAELVENIAAYADELKLVGVFNESTDSTAFATKVYADVLN